MASKFKDRAFTGAHSFEALTQQPDGTWKPAPPLRCPCWRCKLRRWLIGKTLAEREKGGGKREVVD